jgi:hypothetical protein
MSKIIQVHVPVCNLQVSGRFATSQQELYDVPKDTTVANVHYDQNNRCLVLSLSHPSFEGTPAGLHLPMGWARQATVELREL